MGFIAEDALAEFGQGAHGGEGSGDGRGVEPAGEVDDGQAVVGGELGERAIASDEVGEEDVVGRAAGGHGEILAGPERDSSARRASDAQCARRCGGSGGKL